MIARLFTVVIFTSKMPEPYPPRHENAFMWSSVPDKRAEQMTANVNVR
jgi:hypothetical protein